MSKTSFNQRVDTSAPAIFESVNAAFNTRSTKIDLNVLSSYSVLSTDAYISITDILSDKFISLPSAVGNLDREIIIADESGKIDSSNYVQVEPDGSETIDGNTARGAITIPYGVLHYKSDGSNWFSVNELQYSVSSAGDNKLPASTSGSVDPVLFIIPGGNGGAFTISLKTSSSDNQLRITAVGGATYQYTSKSIINSNDFNTNGNPTIAGASPFYFNTSGFTAPLAAQKLANRGDIQRLWLTSNQSFRSVMLDMWVMNCGKNGPNRFRWKYNFHTTPIIA